MYFRDFLCYAYVGHFLWLLWLLSVASLAIYLDDGPKAGNVCLGQMRYHSWLDECFPNSADNICVTKAFEEGVAALKVTPHQPRTLASVRPSATLLPSSPRCRSTDNRQA